MKAVLALGEVMIRLSSISSLTMMQSKQLEMFAGGAEANVLSNLSQWKIPTNLITKLPQHDLGNWVFQEIQRSQIGTSLIQRGGDRVGLYFHENGVGHRPSQVIYDRASSSFQSLRFEDLPLSLMLPQDVSWFHTSGITPALNPSMSALALTLIQTMKKHKIPVSFDVNFRRKLWSLEEARKTLFEWMPYIDFLILNEEDLHLMFNLNMEKTNTHKGSINLDEYSNALSQLIKQFQLKAIAVTLRTSITASHNFWQGMMQTNDKLWVSPKYDIEPIVDRIGSGDAFSAGLIYGFLNQYDMQKSINFATAAGVSKHYILGDFNQASIQWIESLINGDATGRISR
jgi:2-dehydro-3-deoxygluconokinase